MNAMLESLLPAKTWWSREGLDFIDDRLHFCGRDIGALAEAFTEPVFFYDAARLVENVARLRQTLTATGLPFRIYYAMKANRFRPLLCELRRSSLFGLDVCSPEELSEAMACGFAPEEISYTAHGMMPQDAAMLARLPGVHVNCDTLSSISLLGQYSPGRQIGLRINPGVGIGYGNSEKLSYAGKTTTKFGIYAEQLDVALELAARQGLQITWLHCHAGCGYLDGQLHSFTQVLRAIKGFTQKIPGLRGVNLGGGLGLPHRASDRPLDLTRWASLVREQFNGSGLEVAIEPGDFIVKDAGMLALRVAYVETKRDRDFVGLNGGFNLAIEPVFYDLPCEPVPCLKRPGIDRIVTLAGNINEAMDIWASDISLPPMEPGDIMALLNAGGYASSMSSNHCLRGQFREVLLHSIR
jgi:diaminopimelate decarboxylase